MKYFLFLFLLFSTYLSAQEDSLDQIKLLFVGDIMQHQPQIKSAEIVRNKSYDYESCFKYVSPIIRKADLAIGNLEVTLPGRPPYQGYPQFRSPDDLAKGLKRSGFDLLVTANNHSNDAGRTGVVNTIKTLKSHGFYQTGTFKNAEERSLCYPLIVHKNNFKLGFLNYTYDTNGLKTRPPTVVNYIDTVQMKKDLKLAKLLNPDFLIVIMHWGKEYKLVESKKQSRLADWLFQNGADLVIGAHPHVVQPIKLLPTQLATSNQQPATSNLVVYSMGNFISNQTKTNTDGGIMVEIDLTKDTKTNQTQLARHQYIPVWRYIQKDRKGGRKYFAIPVAAFEDGQHRRLKMRSLDVAAMKAFARKTRAHLKKWDGVERKVSFDEIWEY
ncbi:MAG: CapA family protein [Bacteroidota bacterium]